MPDGKVIELSVEETNQLRAQLGLAPLRVQEASPPTTRQPSAPDRHNNNNNNEPSRKIIAAVAASRDNNMSSNKILELSVKETNALRAQLGLKPLVLQRQHGANTTTKLPKGREEQVSGAVAAASNKNSNNKDETKSYLDATTTNTPSLGEEAAGTTALSWAQQMRQQSQPPSSSTARTTTAADTTNNNNDYTERDLQGLHVGHALHELTTDETMVLTLSDAPLLATGTHDQILGLDDDSVPAELQNVDLVAAHQVQRSLRERQRVARGRAGGGGYQVGYDDDEFEEWGGGGTTLGPPRGLREDEGESNQRRGFQIGAALLDEKVEDKGDLLAQFNSNSNKPISLEPTHADVAASDFMTAQEEAELRPKKDKKTKKTKETKFKKKSKKEKKKRRTTEESEEDEEESNGYPLGSTQSGGKGILEELEETAVNAPASRKRRRRDEGDTNEESGMTTNNNNIAMETDVPGKSAPPGSSKVGSNRSRYEQVMAKGNERSLKAFSAPASKKNVVVNDEEPDDAFLNAALSKARRLNRLKDMKQKKGSVAEAVVAAVGQQQDSLPSTTTSSGGGTIEFSVDETREFTIALKARAEQAEREQARRIAAASVKNATSDGKNNITHGDDHGPKSAASMAVKQEEEVEAMDDEKVDIHELAKQVKEEDGDTALQGTTGNSVTIGRGVGNVLSLLKQTGEMTRKNAGKEEMRGRARDKRTYEDYEPLDLAQVVRIDERNATEKDKEFAHREVKLEYRDKHGRLLTRKEAFRDLSYHFHGYGSGKRKEEKKLEQIAREQAEARLAAQSTSLGALQATQKATGKAYVVHKTGNKL